MSKSTDIDIIATQAVLIMELSAVLERFESAFVIAVGEKSPFAKLALKPVRAILNRGES